MSVYDNCSGIIKAVATDVLNIGFKQLRSDKRIIETISIDLESSLIEVNDFRKKFGSSVIIDGRINLDENVSITLVRLFSAKEFYKTTN